MIKISSWADKNVQKLCCGGNVRVLSLGKGFTFKGNEGIDPVG